LVEKGYFLVCLLELFLTIVELKSKIAIFLHEFIDFICRKSFSLWVCLSLSIVPSYFRFLLLLFVPLFEEFADFCLELLDDKILGEECFNQ